MNNNNSLIVTVLAVLIFILTLPIAILAELLKLQK